MGNQCCAGRDHIYKQRLNENELLDENSIVCRGKDDDILHFDAAYENNDIGEFVRLCKSSCQIEKLEEKMHPWAAPPESIGALAATQLAILSSKDEKTENGEENDIKNEIRRAGGILVLVNLLQSTEKDKKHAALVALSFLSVENVENCTEMYKCGALPHLIKGMMSDIDGMRAACAQTARNVYVLDYKYRKDFVKYGGVTELVNLLDPPKDSTSDNLYTQLEAVYHLEDLIIDQAEEIPEFVDVVKNTKAVSKLNVLNDYQWNDNELADAANMLLVRLSD